MLMVAPLLSSCSENIANFQGCSPLPGGLGADCDDFLDSNQLQLNPQQWATLLNSWYAAGDPPVCMRASAVGNVKAEIEKLCSEYPCDYLTQQAITQGLMRLQNMSRVKRPNP
jgi:hypothetical protein